MVKKTGEDGIERFVPSEDPSSSDPVFEGQRTYMYLKLTLTDPVTPPVAQHPEPLP